MFLRELRFLLEAHVVYLTLKPVPTRQRSVFRHALCCRCRLSKRQRTLYEDYMASSDTSATLASSNFLGIINVLMQLRKVRFGNNVSFLCISVDRSACNECTGMCPCDHAGSASFALDLADAQPCLFSATSAPRPPLPPSPPPLMTSSDCKSAVLGV